MAAIEPISSMMTIQAQPVQKVTESAGSTSTQSGTQKPADEFVSSAASEVPQVDPQTLTVRNVAESDEEGSSDGYARRTKSLLRRTMKRLRKQLKILTRT